MDDGELIERMVEILGPCMGANMARSSVKVFINEVKIRHGSFDLSHLPEVIERLRKGLEAFVGREQAQVISDRILDLRNAEARG